MLAHHLDIEHGHASLSFSGFPAVHGLIQIGKLAVPKLEMVLLGSESKTSVAVTWQLLRLGK